MMIFLFLLLLLLKGTGTLTLDTPEPYHYGETLTFSYSVPHTYRMPDFVVWCWNGTMGSWTDADYISETFLAADRSGTVSVVIDAAHSASNYPWAVLDETQPATCSAVLNNDVQKQGRTSITNEVRFDLRP